MSKVLIIDDDTDMCQLLSRYLGRKGFETETAFSGVKGIRKFQQGKYPLVLCDFRLGDKDGFEVLTELRQSDPSVKVIIMTGYSDIKMAVEVMRLGAFDYITKPLVPEEVLSILQRALNEPATPPASVNDINSKKNHGFSTGPGQDEYLVGTSTATKELYRQIGLVSPTAYSVILYGESGTGKEVIAKTIHQQSSRSHKPFVAVDCGTLSRELAASELFGHIKGSFTGAVSDKEGYFEAADGGTLFLDEVANLPLDVQATLLRVIQERKFKRVGSNKDMQVDVRVIVASNENLQEAYRKGKFREDLYHRFNEFSINIPPLRQRREDIIPFAAFFLEKVCGELQKDIPGFDEETIQLFRDYDWPGNLREFRNVIRRAGLLTPNGTMITANVLPWEIIGGPAPVKKEVGSASALSDPPSPGSLDLKDTAAMAEYQRIMEVLKEVKFSKTRAAAILNVDRKTLYNKLKYYEKNNLMPH